MAQCPSCKFENMPQYTTCVRCGSILPGSNVSVEFEPPRAGKIEKTLRLAVVLRTINRLICAIAMCLGWMWQTVWPTTVSFCTLTIRAIDFQIFGMFWQGILPGLAQWYNGRKPHDQFFFFGWLILLFTAFLTFGLSISQFLIGLAIAWHACSIIDIAFITSVRRFDRLYIVGTMALTAIFVFYYPTSTLWWGRVGVVNVYLTSENGPLRRGDALIYWNSRDTPQPQVGDFVIYHTPPVRHLAPGIGPMGRAGQIDFSLAGSAYDRVLATEGQTVSWSGGILTVDGEPPLCQPFIPVTGAPDVTFVVPQGNCYIVPGAIFQYMALPKEADTWRAVGVVPNSSIYGNIWGIRRSLFSFVDIKPVK